MDDGTKKKIKWNKTKSKQTLKANLLDGKVKESMKPKEVFKIHPEYKEEVEYKRFRDNLNKMRKQLIAGTLATKEKKPKWKKSEAKRLLKDDIINGVVKPEVKAKIVYEMWDCYKDYDYSNFYTNLGNLRESISNNIGRMKSDCTAYMADRALLAQLRADNPVLLPPYPIWHKHKASKLLTKDVKEDKHIGVDPEILWKSRPEYEEFPLSVFQKHIYQEADKHIKKGNRYQKKKLRLATPKSRPKATEIEAQKIASSRRFRGEYDDVAYPS